MLQYTYIFKIYVKPWWKHDSKFVILLHFVRHMLVLFFMLLCIRLHVYKLIKNNNAIRRFEINIKFQGFFIKTLFNSANTVL